MNVLAFMGLMGHRRPEYAGFSIFEWPHAKPPPWAPFRYFIDAIFELPRAKKAIMAVRFRLVVSRRGESSVRQLEEDPSIQPFLVPCHLLRAGKLKLKVVYIVLLRTSARLAPASAGSGAGGAPSVRYELSAADKAQVLGRCRVFGE